MFVCPQTRAPLEAWYSRGADTLYPLLNGVPVLVPDPRRFALLHAPSALPDAVVGLRREPLGVDAPDAITPFLSPKELPARGPMLAWLAELGARTPESVCAAWGGSPREGLLVDAGCGLGEMTRHMLDTGRDVVAFDRSPDAVFTAQALLTGALSEAWVPSHARGSEAMASPLGPMKGRLHLAIADVLHPPLPEESVAWLHLGFVLDVLSLEDKVRALIAAAALLKRGGLLTLASVYEGPEPALPAQTRPELELEEALGQLGLQREAVEDDVPRVRRRHDRAYEVLLARCTAWRRP